MIKILKNLTIGLSEWELSTFAFNVDTLNFSEGGSTPTTPSQLITSDNKNFITSDNKNFLVKE